MSKRQTIINGLDAKLKAIKTANGYQTNAGNNVFAWREDELQTHELPGIVYLDRIAGKRGGGSIGSFRWALAVDIYCYAGAGSNTPAEVRKLVADVLKAIGVADTGRWNGQAQATELSDGSEMSIERRGKTAGEAVVNINIIYDAPLWET